MAHEFDKVIAPLPTTRAVLPLGMVLNVLLDFIIVFTIQTSRKSLSTF